MYLFYKFVMVENLLCSNPRDPRDSDSKKLNIQIKKAGSVLVHRSGSDCTSMLHKLLSKMHNTAHPLHNKVLKQSEASFFLSLTSTEGHSCPQQHTHIMSKLLVDVLFMYQFLSKSSTIWPQ